MITLDARGISCPEPLIMLKKALKKADKLILLVDSNNALSNCETFAQKQGFTTKAEAKNGEYTVRISKNR